MRQMRSSLHSVQLLSPYHSRIAIPLTRKSRHIHNSATAEPVTASFQTTTTSNAEGRTAFPPALPPLDSNYESTCNFHPYANWIIPGHVMLGRYPYVEPSRCATRDQGDAQLEAIISAGITTFVSLQQELPPQEEIRIAGIDGFLPYRTPAQLVAAGFSDPPSLEELSQLRTPDLDKFLPPRRKPSNVPCRRVINLEFLHYPIVDLGIPSLDELEQLISELSGRVQKGEKLYVHCWGGRGRAGTVGAALLASWYGIGADEALDRVQRSFDTRKDEQRRSPETPEQHAFVREFINTRLHK